MTERQAKKLVRKIERSGQYAAQIVRGPSREVRKVEAVRVQSGKVVR